MNIQGHKAPHDSPCIGRCTVSLGDKICKGCGRSEEQVTNWGSYTEAEKVRINNDLHANHK